MNPLSRIIIGFFVGKQTYFLKNRTKILEKNDKLLKNTKLVASFPINSKKSPKLLFYENFRKFPKISENCWPYTLCMIIDFTAINRYLKCLTVDTGA